MLLTESNLRKIIAEEYEKLVKEGWSGRRVAAMRSGGYGGFSHSGGASDSDAALQTLFSIFYKKTDQDMESRPELVQSAKNLYKKYVDQFGKEVVDKYIQKHNLGIISKYAGVQEAKSWKMQQREKALKMSAEEEKEYKKKYGEKEDARVPRKARGGDDYRKGDD